MSARACARSSRSTCLPARARLRARDAGLAAARLRPLRRRGRAPRAADDRARGGMGGSVALERSRPAGAAAGDRSAVRALPGAARSGDRGAAGRAARPGAAPPAGAHLQRRRARRAARAGGPLLPRRRAAPAHLRGLLLAARLRPGCGSPRPAGSNAATSTWTPASSTVRRGQVPQVPARPSPPERDPGARAATPPSATARSARPGCFFRTERAPALTAAAVEKTFSRIRQRLGWTGEGRAGRPRIHDLRHTFAVASAAALVRGGRRARAKLLALSTYLGHAQVTTPTGT